MKLTRDARFTVRVVVLAMVAVFVLTFVKQLVISELIK